MNYDDLWNKARLFYAFLYYIGKTTLPSFATYYNFQLILNKIDNIDFAHQLLLKYISRSKTKFNGRINNDNSKEYIEDDKKEQESIFKQNLINLQFN